MTLIHYCHLQDGRPARGMEKKLLRKDISWGKVFFSFFFFVENPPILESVLRLARRNLRQSFSTEENVSTKLLLLLTRMAMMMAKLNYVEARVRKWAVGRL